MSATMTQPISTKEPQQQNSAALAQEHKEGPLARAIEEQTAKLPSDIFLLAALGSMGVSALLQLTGKKRASLFVGEWVAPFLLFGVYNKIVKVEGSDKTS
jgi:hypothetical protein